MYSPVWPCLSIILSVVPAAFFNEIGVIVCEIVCVPVFTLLTPVHVGRFLWKPIMKLAVYYLVAFTICWWVMLLVCSFSCIVLPVVNILVGVCFQITCVTAVNTSIFAEIFMIKLGLWYGMAFAAGCRNDCRLHLREFPVYETNLRVHVRGMFVWLCVMGFTCRLCHQCFISFFIGNYL